MEILYALRNLLDKIGFAHVGPLMVLAPSVRRQRPAYTESDHHTITDAGLQESSYLRGDGAEQRNRYNC